MDEGEELYDEFGNYIGPDLDESSSSSDSESSVGVPPAAAKQDHQAQEVDSEAEDDDGDVPMSSAVVLHEDKQYYQAADEVFPTAEVLVEEQDLQDIDEPIIRPIKVKSFSAFSSDDAPPPDLKYSPSFLSHLLSSSKHLQRNVAIVGHLHHGKTSLCDVLRESTLLASKPVESRAVRFTDTRKDEQERKVSIKLCPMAMVLENGDGKSFAVNVLDCPGHVCFSDETTMAVPVVDGVVLVVDAVEGVMLNTKRSLKLVCENHLPIVLCISKLDRLIHELKLPPNDAYLKLVHIIDNVNAEIAKHQHGNKTIRKLSPVRGNVLFSSATDGWCFSLQSFARLYIHRKGSSWCNVDPVAFARRLWGNKYFDKSSRTFVKEPDSIKHPRSFVQFILEPLYKLYGQVLGEDADALAHTLNSLGITLSKKTLLLDAKPLLHTVMREFFAPEQVSGFVDAVVEHIPPPGTSLTHFVGPRNSPMAKAISDCNPDGPLLVFVSKLFSSPDGKSFSAFGKVFSGTLKVGQAVRILGESYSKGDKEDMAVGTVDGLSICMARHRLAVDAAVAGNLVLIEGVDEFISKHATLCDLKSEMTLDEIGFIRPPPFDNASVVKLAIEPLNPRELPKMLHGLRCVNKSYPLLKTKVEESGEHVIFGTGELYMDCVMHDLREMYAEIEIRVSDPIVPFCETIVETSSLKTHAKTPNDKNRLTMIAEPLDPMLGVAIESGRVSIQTPELSELLEKEFHWDKLAARTLWAFGPTEQGPNAILNDTLSSTDRSLLDSVRGTIVQGFRWATREGPLCDEPMRNVKFRLLDANIAMEPLHRGAGFMIPTARRVAYSSFLTATPRLMEPMYFLEVQAPDNMDKAIDRVLRRRRGHLVKHFPVPGAPFTLFHGYMPVIDSFGFETDLRVHTRGQAFVHQVFDRWDVVPGDPLDENIVIRPLEPCRGKALAREFLVKTRRRKGLPLDVYVTKYFADDQEMMRAYERNRRSGALSEEEDSSSDSDSADDEQN